MTSKHCDDGKVHHSHELELSGVVLHAGEMSDVTLLKDYLQMTKLTGELNVNEADSKKCTALHFAVSTKKLDIVKLLVDYGANVNFRDYMGFTPLMFATGRYADVEVASYLIVKCKASVHTTTDTGACALHGAALCGNLDCISLLLKHGADARCSDHDGNTPLDLAKDVESKKLLQKALRHLDHPSDDADRCCHQCGATENDLKRCSQCFVARYCSRECQMIHWKAGHRDVCKGFVIGRTKSSRGGYTSLFNLQKLQLVTHNGEQTAASNVQKKKFIVKVQVPMNVGGSDMKDSDQGEMMCYNEDRSITGFIATSEKDYGKLRETIAKDGYMGVKAFFWAELDIKAADGSFRVFHGKCAPYQSW